MAMYPKPPTPKTKATGMAPKPKPRSMPAPPIGPKPKKLVGAELDASIKEQMGKGKQLRQQTRKKKMGY